MMTDWYQRSINALQLNGKGERTQDASTRAVRMLSTFYSKPPDEITEAELEAYVLRRRNVDHWSPNTMRICSGGIRFFFVHALQRTWHLFDILRAKSEARSAASEAPRRLISAPVPATRTDRHGLRVPVITRHRHRDAHPDSIALGAERERPVRPRPRDG